MQTLYTVHHETSRAASRKLSLWFWSGVVLSFASYSLVSWGFFALIFWLFETSPPPLSTFAMLIGLATSLIVIYGYYLARSDAQNTAAHERAAELGAELLGTPRFAAEKQYRNIVEEMAVAAGVSPPEIMINRANDSINAFVIGGAKGSTAIAVTAGALRYLSRDELQALIAHEFGHIVNDDLVLYGRLTAMVHGYRYFADIRYRLLGNQDDSLNLREKMLLESADPQNEAEALAIRQLAYASATRRRENESEAETLRLQAGFGGYGLLFAALIVTLSAYSSLLTWYARLMQAAIAREREWMADAKAVQFTRNGAALAGVFKKVLALGKNDAPALSILVENRHLLLIDYLQAPGNKRLHTHPDTRARLARYGDYREEEIDQLRYALQDIPPYDRIDAPPERSATHFADARFPFMLLRHHAAAAHPDLPASALALAAMMRLANATPKGLYQARLLDKSTLQHLLPAWKKLLPAHQASFLPALLAGIARHPDPETLRADLDAIARSDGLQSFPEWCAFVALDARTQPPPPALSRQEGEASIRSVLRLAAHLCADNDPERAALFAELPRHTLPIASTPWQTVATQKAVPAPCKGKDESGWPIEPLHIPDDHELQTARHAILELRALRPIYRQSLINGLAQILQQRSPIPLDAYHYLLLLQTLLK